MKYLHTMVRVSDLDASTDFYCNKLGLEELRRVDVEAGRFTLVFLAAPGDSERESSMVCGTIMMETQGEAKQTPGSVHVQRYPGK